MTKIDDTHFMHIALGEARKAVGFTSPNPLVGAVVVKDHRIVGKGRHEFPGGPHAEVNAINAAGDMAAGATLYVTLEPCNHTGRTPPCTEKILAAGIKKVVVAADDPNPDVTGGGNAFLRSRGIPVISGVCEEKAKKQNETYIKYVKTKTPFVVLKCAATLDGRIATRTGDAKWISNAWSRTYVHELRHTVDAIMVGMGTIRADNPRLTTRLPQGINGKKAKDPLRIILDPRFSIAEDATVLRIDSDSDTVIVTGSKGNDPAWENKRKRLEKMGARVTSAPVHEGRIDLKALMVILGEMAVTSLLIEGGSRVLASALAHGIVDKVLFFYAPKLLGGDDGIPICTGFGPEHMEESLQVQDICVKRFGDDVLIEGYLKA